MDKVLAIGAAAAVLVSTTSARAAQSCHLQAIGQGFNTFETWKIRALGGSLLAIGNEEGRYDIQIKKIDVLTGATSNIPVDDPNGMDVSSGKLYCSIHNGIYAENHLSQIDPDTGKEITAYGNFGDWGSGFTDMFDLAVSGNNAYVQEAEDKSLHAINLSTGAETVIASSTNLDDFMVLNGQLIEAESNYNQEITSVDPLSGKSTASNVFSADFNASPTKGASAVTDTGSEVLVMGNSEKYVSGATVYGGQIARLDRATLQPKDYLDISYPGETEKMGSIAAVNGRIFVSSWSLAHGPIFEVVCGK